MGQSGHSLTSPEVGGDVFGTCDGLLAALSRTGGHGSQVLTRPLEHYLVWCSSLNLEAVVLSLNLVNMLNLLT